MKYIILSDGSPEGFKTPRQLSEINGEPIIKRTIRLLKENGITDIIITSHDKRFDNLGVERYEPKYNDWNYKDKTGYWLSAFPIELLNQPITFLFGDVYYSENAIKTIVNTKTKENLFFCTYENKDKRYIKHHDEPLAYKVVDYIMFKEHIDRVKRLKDEGKCCREPIVWELYRSINNQDINVHVMTNNYIAINDESCDIDTFNDIINLEEKLGENKMIKCEVIENFTLGEFQKISNLKRATSKEKEGCLYVGDTFECDEEMAKYLTGGNDKNKIVVKILEVIPKTNSEIKFTEEKLKPKAEIKLEEKTKKKKTSKKKKGE